MASLNAKAISFDKIRLIVCVNGFTIENEFLVKEIGFWSRKQTGIIPFSTKKPFKNLNAFDLLTVNYLYKAHHGINLKSQSKLGMMSYEASAALKCLYNVCHQEFDTDDRKYIGYSNDHNVLALLYRAGLAEYSVNIQNIYDEQPPSNFDIVAMKNYGYGFYAPCFMHDALESSRPAICAKIKSIILAEWCNEKEKNRNSDRKIN
jgi:hypothetical protein